MKQHGEVKRRISPDVYGADQTQDIEIQNIPNSLSNREIADRLHALDTTVPSATYYTNMSTKGPLQTLAGEGVSPHKTAVIRKVPISDKLLATLNGEPGTAPSSEVAGWYVRTEVLNGDADRPCLQIKTTNRIKAQLTVLLAAGFSKCEIEQLAKTAINQALQSCAACGTVIGVTFSDAKRVTLHDGSFALKAVRFEDYGAGRIIFRSEEALKVAAGVGEAFWSPNGN